MKLAFGSWTSGTFFDNYTSENVGSGYENIALACGGQWKKLSEEVNNEYDIVLCCSPTGHDIITKSPKWGKLYLLEEAGFGIINTHWFYEKLLDMPVDGFLIHSEVIRPLFESIGKPVYSFKPPYPLERIRKKQIGVYNPKVVALNMSRVLTPEANISATIRLCQILPDHTFITYCSDKELLDRICKKANVTNWKIYSHRGFEHYIEQIRNCGIGASLDNRDTWGRFQLDLYALGKISVGCYSGTQALLYPKEFMVDRCDVKGLADLIEEKSGQVYLPVPQEKELTQEAFRKIINIL